MDDTKWWNFPQNTRESPRAPQKWYVSEVFLRVFIHTVNILFLYFSLWHDAWMTFSHFWGIFSIYISNTFHLPSPPQNSLSVVAPKMYRKTSLFSVYIRIYRILAWRMDDTVKNRWYFSVWNCTQNGLFWWFPKTLVGWVGPPKIYFTF